MTLDIYKSIKLLKRKNYLLFGFETVKPHSGKNSTFPQVRGLSQSDSKREKRGCASPTPRFFQKFQASDLGFCNAKIAKISDNALTWGFANSIFAKNANSGRFSGDFSLVVRVSSSSIAFAHFCKAVFSKETGNETVAGFTFYKQVILII